MLKQCIDVWNSDKCKVVDCSYEQKIKRCCITCKKCSCRARRAQLVAGIGQKSTKVLTMRLVVIQFPCQGNTPDDVGLACAVNTMHYESVQIGRNPRLGHHSATLLTTCHAAHTHQDRAWPQPAGVQQVPLIVRMTTACLTYVIND